MVHFGASLCDPECWLNCCLNVLPGRWHLLLSSIKDIAAESLHQGGISLLDLSLLLGVFL